MSRQDTVFISPETHEQLYHDVENSKDVLVAESGVKYEFVNGFPDLVYPKILSDKSKHFLDYFGGMADIYDKYLGQTFKTYFHDENATRNKFIDKLNIKSDSKVLEIACGTGRDSELIAKRIGKDGRFAIVDIAPTMLAVCREKLAAIDIDKVFCRASAAALPFPDNYFDATYCALAVEYFPDVKKSLAEMARVTKVGGKIVFWDESMPPWLRDTYFCKVLTTNNPPMLGEVPIKDLPVEARNVTIQWVIGGVFYLIDFEVGDGEPTANFDYEIEGTRGGTLRTRYEGRLEGVTPEAKELAYKAAKEKGLTMHKWLEETVREAAKKDLKL